MNTYQPSKQQAVRFSLSEMFPCELKLDIDLLKKWLADK